MENKSLKPKIRFKGFTEAWEQRKVTDVGKIFIGLVTTMTKNYTDVGTLLIRNSDIKDNHFEFDSNPIHLDEGFAKLNDSRRMHIGDVVTVHTGDVGTSAVITEKEDGSIGFATIVTRPNKEIIDSNYLSTYLNTEQHKNWAINQSTGDGRTNYNLKEFTQLIVPLPSLKEQQCISKYIKQIDNLITLHQRKCDKLVNIKKSLLEKMFPKNGNNVPEIRFKGFTEAWEQRKLLDMCSIVTKQTGFDYSARIKPSLVVEKNKDTYSFIQNKDFCGNNINFDTDFYIPIEVAKQYPKITLDTPSILVSISGKIGNVGFYNHKEVAFIGGAVGICKLLNEEDGAFSVYELESDYGQKYFQSLIKASSHANITVEDIRNIQLVLPKSDIEKKKIQNLFENIDNLITLHQRKLFLKYKKIVI